MAIEMREKSTESVHLFFSRMIVESGVAEGIDKQCKDNQNTDSNTPCPDRRIASKTTSKESSGKQSNEKKPASIGTVTRSRVVKRPKRDLSPPESPVKKAALLKLNQSTPETKTKRQWGLWSLKDKDAFFEGLFEFGKDFDAIQSLIAQKCKKKGVVPSLIKNKDQVRHFYYRTWHKIAKYIKIDSAVSDTNHVIQNTFNFLSLNFRCEKGISGIVWSYNYGVLRKKIKGLNEKDGLKLGELVHNGYTIVKVRGKNVRIKTPTCNALKKLNNVEEPKDDPGEKVPEKINVEFCPRTNAAWAHVQEMSQNPRVKMMLKPDRKLASVINFLIRKWKPHRLKLVSFLRESLDGESESLKHLVVFPPKECDITPVSLNAVHETRVQLAFSNYKEQIMSSPTVNKGKKDVNNKVSCDNLYDVCDGNVIHDSPKTGKGQYKEGRNRTTSNSMDISALVEGDNAMFPDSLLSSTEESDKQTEPGSEGSSGDKMCDNALNMGNSDIVLERGHESSGCESDKTIESEIDDPQTIKLKDVIENGWTASRAENLTIAELYLMFGKDDKMRLEYDWCVEDQDLTTQLTNMLRRLVNLATLEFTDFCKSGTPSGNSPCHACGTVRGTKNASCRNVSNVKGQRSNNRSPLSSKFGAGASGTHCDVSTQTSNESSGQSKEAVFRVPVAGAAFLQQRNTVPSGVSSIPNSTRQIINQADLFVRPNDRHGKKIRSVRSNVQRRLLPKALPSKQLLTLIPVSNSNMIRSPTTGYQQALVSQAKNNVRLPNQQTIIGHPIGIPVTDNNGFPATTSSNTNVLNVPTSSLNRDESSVSLGSLTGITIDDSSQSKSQDILSLLNVHGNSTGGVEGSNNLIKNNLIGNVTVNISKSNGNTTEVSNSMNTEMKTGQGSLSPPNISSLLDISLSNLPPGSSESADKFIDIALGGNSNSGFSIYFVFVALLGSKELSLDPALMTPPVRKSESLTLQTSPPQSPSRWLNGEDTGDISLSTFLTESPMKHESSTSVSLAHSASSLMQGPLFSDNSRDSMMGRLDVDATLQCMLNENSMDYANKFADLAAHIANDTLSKNT
ncbi:hypothetical protein KUTeg_001211 [Tegillarca granosa]|uniref:Cramped n=1 Tax=Tegillarca granosa TaxID=220873 RepID=A0ABQ9FYB6_TEGGR|nr:hypothetical protein KUTeg_001211 [Tegillarca granosa]